MLLYPPSRGNHVDNQHKLSIARELVLQKSIHEDDDGVQPIVEGYHRSQNSHHIDVNGVPQEDHLAERLHSQSAEVHQGYGCEMRKRHAQ